MKRLIKKGAEADVYLTSWNGSLAILKHRKIKSYRHPSLDLRIRRQRTIREAEIISHVKSYGISSPLVYFVDTKQSKIVMQFVRGSPVSDLPSKKLISACKDIGYVVGTLHKNGIMHGDLTTSNFIISKDSGRLFIIDFGLSQRTDKPDDHAVDLRLIKEILNSAHAKVMEKAWDNFLSGYKSSVGLRYFNKIMKLVEIIESRGRYATVV